MLVRMGALSKLFMHAHLSRAWQDILHFGASMQVGNEAMAAPTMLMLCRLWPHVKSRSSGCKRFRVAPMAQTTPSAILAGSCRCGSCCCFLLHEAHAGACTPLPAHVCLPCNCQYSGCLGHVHCDWQLPAHWTDPLALPWSDWHLVSFHLNWNYYGIISLA